MAEEYVTCQQAMRDRVGGMLTTWGIYAVYAGWVEFEIWAT